MDSPKDSDSQSDLTLFYTVTLLSLYSSCIPILVSVLTNLFTWDSQVETSLKRQVSDLREELGSVSMMDEFAKYSKIQRKLNKAKDELTNKNNSQLIFQTKAKLLFYILFYSISIFCFITIHLKHYHEPLLFFRSDLLYPIAPLLSFPTGQANCLSIMSWSFISGFVFRLALKNIF